MEKESQVDQLATIVAKALDRVDDRLSIIERQNVEMNSEILGIHGSIDKLTTAVVSIDTKVNEIGKQLSRVVDIIEPLVNTVNAVKVELQQHDVRLTKIEEKVL